MSTDLLTRAYRFYPGVVVRLRTGRREVVSYFDAEYGPSITETDGEPDIAVYVGRDFADQASGETTIHRGRHKTIAWRIGISGLDDSVTRLAFDGRGTMAISFLQTFYLEPLIRPRVAELGAAMVHAGAIGREDGAVLLVAGTGAGKTTVVTLQAVRGGTAFGDNYVIVTPDGRVTQTPRRLRLYSDFVRTNPEGYRRLSPGTRLRMRFLEATRTLSLGYANLPVRIPISDLRPGQEAMPQAGQLKRLVLLTSHSGNHIVGPAPIDCERVIERIEQVGADEAKRLRPVITDHLASHEQCRYRSVEALETPILRKAFDGLPAYELMVPRVREPGPVASQVLGICRAI